MCLKLNLKTLSEHFCVVLVLTKYNKDKNSEYIFEYFLWNMFIIV